MKIDRQVSLKRETAIRIRDAFRAATFHCPTSAEMTARLNEITASWPKDTPNHIKDYIAGFIDALQTEMIDSLVIYGGIYEGKFYSVNSARDDYYGKAGISPLDWSLASHKSTIKDMGLYWAKDTSKLYFKADR